MNETKAPFEVGDKVTSDYFGKEEAGVVRTIEACVKDAKCQSGWVASADGGEVCPTCKRACSTIIEVDSSWFKKVQERGKE